MLTHLECGACALRHDADRLQNLCTACGLPLLARYDLAHAGKTGEPSLSIPCYAERRFGGVADDELLMAIPPSYLPKVLEGLAQLDKRGLRYPISPWSVQADPSASLAVSYGGKF